MRFAWAILLLLVAGLVSHHAAAADLPTAKAQFKSGSYLACLSECEGPVADGIWNEEWYRLKCRTELILGRYADAEETLRLGLDKYSSSIYLRLLGFEILRMNDRPEEARELLNSIDETVRRYPWRFSDAINRIVIGRYSLLIGEDPKDVLESFYDPAKNLNPRLVDSYISAAELALDKYDYELASLELQRAVVIDDESPEAHFLLAKAFAPTDPERTESELRRALELNPNLLDALLWTADQAIDREDYEFAEQQLSRVERVNPVHPELWAYRATLAHLQGDFELEAEHRSKALQSWTTNPEVDHLIGLKLSQRYRFQEGAQYQRAALELDADFLPAQFQLSQDLLRLGQEAEGWELAEQVYDRDNYNTVAHNLVTLRSVIDGFVSLERDGIVIRMSALEAGLYGQRVLELLTEAKQVLGSKYKIEIQEPVIVEIFPEQKDFAIRTFGVPGGQGFLGVCFGNVITANSPASQASHPTNWEATLWHEFCHVVTLQKTNNRMPRWLSEGISVYEERQRNPGWGQSMNSAYRRMIVGGELTPVSELSSAFMRPPSAQHLQFAYYESSLVVQYLVDHHGLEILLSVLDDLAIGMPINESLARYVGTLDGIDQQFETYARQLADELAMEADWADANLSESAGVEEIQAWLSENPDNLQALRSLARRQVSMAGYEAALPTLERIVELYDGTIDQVADYVLLARAYRELEQAEDEIRVLELISEGVADSVATHERLLELATASKDWDAAQYQAGRLLAINPLIEKPHLALALSSEMLGQSDMAIQANRALLQFSSSNRAEVNFKLAGLLVQRSEWAAARQAILECLADAPRFREAYQLYLLIEQGQAAAEGLQNE